MTVPSLKVHLTTSVSSEAPLTYSEPLRADQNLEKSWILMRCQTWERGARMTADSLTEVEVGMADMVKDLWVCCQKEEEKCVVGIGKKKTDCGVFCARAFVLCNELA